MLPKDEQKQPIVDAFKFPQPLKVFTKIANLLDSPSGEDWKTDESLGTTAYDNVKKHMKYFEEQNCNPEDTCYVLDCDAARANTYFLEEISPCITRSRAKGHWLTSKKRRMTIEEMARLQGIRPETFTKVVNDYELGQQLGNAMSVNVVERLLQQVFSATKILPDY